VLINPTIQKLSEMRLLGMLKAMEEQQAQPTVGELSFDERLSLLIDREYSERKNQQFRNRIKRAKTKEQALIEDIDYSKSRGLQKQQILSLSSCEWVRGQQNIIVSGPTGVGKTYLACALLHSACREGFTAKYVRIPRFLREITVSKIDGSYGKMMADIARTDVVLFDDIGLSKLSGEEAREFLEIMEDRHALRSSILTSQLDPDKWYELIPDPTIADALLDRIIHRSHRIKLTGPSLRKTMSRLTPVGQMN
jgi:DNA replication protein DnaC